jgi:hypothetical protein
MSGCRNRQDLTFQYPCSFRFPPLREGNRALVPPACRGNLKEGVLNCLRFGEVWFGNWHYLARRMASMAPLR